ncbi:hypothetical protein AAFF_G00069520 [Aldrovandia affinis]|uniref:Scaffolding anchor of CK1 domain-containing protein n=1 Tax=Aldrovandia affinis TaxID=143900 RepID=A0AAD7RZG6_9TELE|nr:hypothetical protein AAFF_G00069520 [Aldrovandia affinis]
MYQSAVPFERQLSQLSSLTGELDPEDYVQPHYKESYRLAIYALVSGGKDAYYDFLKAEQIGNFLSERELLYILENVEQPAESYRSEETTDDACSSGTYWPMESDLETPDLDLGWPTVVHEIMETSINLLFHPPRQNCPTIKEVIRKHIQEAKQVIAIVMDIFTDVDIFKEIVEASLRGIAVYVLLDDFHIKDFLSMAEQQDVQIQKMRNMRVRTVKGLGYLCRSGARFHGAMEQKFILVDSQTVVYGSYSFMWSYEKINLSLVQVITGQLVKGFDEEFRVLFARSTAPTVGLMESVSLDGKHNGVSSVGVCAPRFTQPFTRRDQPNHILDMVYKRACGRQPGSKHSMAENEVKLRNKRPVDNRSAINHSNGTQHRLHQLQGMDTCDFLKRHSYGGERQEGPCIPNQSTETNAASNWNAIRGGDPLRPGRVSRLYNRDISKRQSYHGTDKQVLSLQESLPSWEQTTKSCLRMRRIKSYLDNTDSHDGNSNDNGEPAGTQCDGLDSRPNQYVLSRLRSSIVFTSTIPEHPESNVNTTSTSSTQCGSSTSRTPYPSMRWNPVKSVESRMRQDDYSFKRHSFHTLDEPSGSKNLGPVREPYQPVYLNHDRTRGNQSVQNPDIRKKYSLAEPTPNAENGASEEPPSGRVCGGLSENGESEGTTSPRPCVTREVRAFLGMAEFCRQWVPGFSVIAAPLTALLTGKPGPFGDVGVAPGSMSPTPGRCLCPTPASLAAFLQLEMLLLQVIHLLHEGKRPAGSDPASPGVDLLN